MCIEYSTLIVKFTSSIPLLVYVICRNICNYTHTHPHIYTHTHTHTHPHTLHVYLSTLITSTDMNKHTI